MADVPAYLTVGTAVSAKYRGAFCEARVKIAKRLVKCKINFKDGTSGIVLDESIKGHLKVGEEVEAKHPETNNWQEGVINKVTDASTYTVVFDDGDEKTLKRTSLCLQGEKHFHESETLDQMPLTDPENFGTPVMKDIRGSRKKRSLDSSRADDDEDEEEIEAEMIKKLKREEPDNAVGKVVIVEMNNNRKSTWFPALIVDPSCTKDVGDKGADIVVTRSFKDNKYYTVADTNWRSFTSKDHIYKGDNTILRTAVEKAVIFIETGQMPQNWDVEMLRSKDRKFVESDDSTESSEDSSDDEYDVEKDAWLASLHKFMEERGTPINKPPVLNYRDLNLHKLYKLVQDLGGCRKVTDKQQWRYISSKMGIPPFHTTQSHNIKAAYNKYLSAFEEHNRKLGPGIRNVFPRTRRRHSHERFLSMTPPKIPKEEERKREEVREEPEDKKEEIVQETEDEKVEEDVKMKQTPVAVKKKTRRKTLESMDTIKDADDIREKTEEQEEDKDQETPGKSKIDDKKEVKGKGSAKKTKKSDKEESSTKDDLDIEPLYDVGEKVQVNYGRGRAVKTYEAKIVKFSVENGEIIYNVHYAGWNNRYDEKVTAERIVGSLEKSKEKRRAKQDKEKQREREVKEKLRKEQEAQREKEQREREKKEKEIRERERQKEREKREREREADKIQKELEEKQKREKKEKEEREKREKREREERERKARREQEEQDKRDKKEREEREKRDRELKEKREREIREKKEKELNERKEKEKREKELKEKRERELREKHEKEQKEREVKELEELKEKERIAEEMAKIQQEQKEVYEGEKKIEVEGKRTPAKRGRPPSASPKGPARPNSPRGPGGRSKSPAVLTGRSRRSDRSSTSDLPFFHGLESKRRRSSASSERKLQTDRDDSFEETDNDDNDSPPQLECKTPFVTETSPSENSEELESTQDQDQKDREISEGSSNEEPITQMEGQSKLETVHETEEGSSSHMAEPPLLRKESTGFEDEFKEEEEPKVTEEVGEVEEKRNIDVKRGKKRSRRSLEKEAKQEKKESKKRKSVEPPESKDELLQDSASGANSQVVIDQNVPGADAEERLKEEEKADKTEEDGKKRKGKKRGRKSVEEKEKSKQEKKSKKDDTDQESPKRGRRRKRRKEPDGTEDAPPVPAPSQTSSKESFQETPKEITPKQSDSSNETPAVSDKLLSITTPPATPESSSGERSSVNDDEGILGDGSSRDDCNSQCDLGSSVGLPLEEADPQDTSSTTEKGRKDTNLSKENKNVVKGGQRGSGKKRKHSSSVTEGSAKKNRPPHKRKNSGRGRRRTSSMTSVGDAPPKDSSSDTDESSTTENKPSRANQKKRERKKNSEDNSPSKTMKGAGSPRPCKYNFLIDLSGVTDQDERIALIQKQLIDLRKIYLELKTEVATIDRKRKKFRRKEREAAAAAALMAAKSLATISEQPPKP